MGVKAEKLYTKATIIWLLLGFLDRCNDALRQKFRRSIYLQYTALRAATRLRLGLRKGDSFRHGLIQEENP